MVSIFGRLALRLLELQSKRGGKVSCAAGSSDQPFRCIVGERPLPQLAKRPAVFWMKLLGRLSLTSAAYRDSMNKSQELVERDVAI